MFPRFVKECFKVRVLVNPFLAHCHQTCSLRVLLSFRIEIHDVIFVFFKCGGVPISCGKSQFVGQYAQFIGAFI